MVLFKFCLRFNDTTETTTKSLTKAQVSDMIGCRSAGRMACCNRKLTASAVNVRVARRENAPSIDLRSDTGAAAPTCWKVSSERVFFFFSLSPSHSCQVNLAPPVMSNSSQNGNYSELSNKIGGRNSSVSQLHVLIG